MENDRIKHLNFKSVMKAKKYKLLIQEPCHEDWNKMSVQEQGRYCSVCKTVVTDFTTMSEEEIIAWLQKSKQTTCGRIRIGESQLNHTYVYATRNENPFKNVVFRYTVAGILSFSAIKAQQQGVVAVHSEQQMQKDNAGNVSSQKTSIIKKSELKTKKITLRVTSSFTGKNLNGAYVLINSEQTIYRAENNSSFIVIEVPDSLCASKITLDIYCPGYMNEYKEITFKNEERNLALTLTLNKGEHCKMGKMIYVPKNTVEIPNEKN
jgi:hypothetical protein